MNIINQILIISAPLLLASFGALVSEYAGRMAIFLEGIINMGAFLCFACTTATHSVAIGICLSLIICTTFITLDAYVSEKLNANPFLSALALNLLCSALISVLSARIFGTRGVLLSQKYFYFSAASTRIATTIFSYLLFATGLCLLLFTKSGLYMRITGSDSEVLKSRGVSTVFYKILSWGIAAFFASAAGCVFALRLSSFVPGVSSGTGWTALAVVFLGKKKPAAVIAAVLVFSAAQFAASNLQNFPGFQSLPSALLLSLPYLVSLILILLLPKRRPNLHHLFSFHRP